MILEKTAYYQTFSNPTVAQLVLAYLALEGVTKLFGIPGAAVMHLLEELRLQSDQFEYVICRQETGAAFIADGFARVTGKLGVVLVTSGPGATNALTGTMNADNSRTPLLTITGEVPEQYFGKGYLQEGIDANLNIDTIYRSASQYSAVLTNPANVQSLLTQALREALSLPGRATHLSLPDDVAATPMGNVVIPQSPANYRAAPDSANPAKVGQAFQLLLAANRPLLFLGNGCRAVLQGERLHQFEAFVEKFAIAVMTTPDAKGVFPETNFYSLRNYGSAACQWPALYMTPANDVPYDTLAVIGSSLGGFTTNKWNPILIPTGPFIQVDLDQSIIGRAFPVALGIVADCGQVLDQWIALGQATTPNPALIQRRRAFLETVKAVSPFRNPERRDSEASPILPEALMKTIMDLMPANGHYFIDCANCVGWSLHYLVVDPPGQMHNSLNMGPMGFGVCSVIGGKLGAPDRTCVAIVGDGAFMMHGSEISTAAQHGVGAIWIVLDDNDLTMVSQGMNYQFPNPSHPDYWKDYYAIGRPDLARFAEGLGAEVYSVHSPADMRTSFPKAIARAESQKRPQVILAHINTSAIPPYYPPQSAHVPTRRGTIR